MRGRKRTTKQERCFEAQVVDALLYLHGHCLKTSQREKGGAWIQAFTPNKQHLGRFVCLGLNTTGGFAAHDAAAITLAPHDYKSTAIAVKQIKVQLFSDCNFIVLSSTSV